MKMKRPFIKALTVFLALLLGAPLGVLAQSGGEEKPFKQGRVGSDGSAHRPLP